MRGLRLQKRHGPESALPPVKEVFPPYGPEKSFRYMAIGGGLHAFVGYGVGYWILAFFMRTHDFTSTEIGTALFWLGIPNMAGTFLGGLLGDRFAKRDVRWYVWLPGLATL